MDASSIWPVVYLGQAAILVRVCVHTCKYCTIAFHSPWLLEISLPQKGVLVMNIELLPKKCLQIVNRYPIFRFPNPQFLEKVGHFVIHENYIFWTNKHSSRLNNLFIFLQNLSEGGNFGTPSINENICLLLIIFSCSQVKWSLYTRN